MKSRIVSGKYSNIFHIEQLFQEAIEMGGDVPLPAIEQPHIYHYLMSKMTYGNVMIAIDDGKLVGVGILEGTSYPWNSAIATAVGYTVVRNIPNAVEMEAMLITAMTSHAHRLNSPFFLQRFPGIRCRISDAELAEMGATVRDGTAIFLLPAGMENSPE